LAWGPDDNLYVTGPTLSTQDSVYRVSPEGEVENFFKGVGRPQGLAFDAGGTLHVAASYRGRRGLFAVNREEARLVVTGPMLVGLAYSADGNVLYLVDGSHLYQIELS
jgi:sugar lactone lactonase YvrE